MENKENYIVIIPSSILNSQKRKMIDYSNLTSANVISVKDVNNLASDIQYCIDTLSAVCNDQFCQLMQNNDYYIEVINNWYPRVLSYNGLTGAISAVFSNSKINDQYLSAYQTNLNLLTYDKNVGYSLVKSINGSTGDISGLTAVKINDTLFEYNELNQGNIILGNFKYIDSDHPYLKTINKVSGNIKIPTGIVYTKTNEVFEVDFNGNCDITKIFNDVLTVDNKEFTNLYVKEVNPTNPSAVVNVNYINSLPQLKIECKNISLRSVDIKIDNGTGGTGKNYISISPVEYDNFLSFIYGIQNGYKKDIYSFNINPSQNEYFDSNYYSKGIPLTFVLLSGQVNQTYTLKLKKIGAPEEVTLSYSKNYGPYAVFPTNGVPLNIGDIVSISGTNTKFSLDLNSYYSFDIENSTVFACYGNVMSLVNWASNIEYDYQFVNLFLNTKMVKAPSLPATTLTKYCYYGMFEGCYSLVIPPQLPASALFDSCYKRMFYNCVALSTVPILPATTLADKCYEGMFYGCTSLTILPYYLLPATELKPSCYASMFSGCANITDGPLLPAMLLPKNANGTVDVTQKSCYSCMFDKCTSLTAIHTNCHPSSLIQVSVPESILGQSSDYIHDWITSHNYAAYWLDGASNVTLYNTTAWNLEYQDTKYTDKHGNILYKEQFYYNRTDNNIPTNITRVGRSLIDTPFSFEFVDGGGVWGGTPARDNWGYGTAYEPYEANDAKRMYLRPYRKAYNYAPSYSTWLQTNFGTKSNKRRYFWRNHEGDGPDWNGIWMFKIGSDDDHDAAAGDIVSISGDSSHFSQYDNGTPTHYIYFSTGGGCRVKLLGNIMSLINPTSAALSTLKDLPEPFCFYRLFNSWTNARWTWEHQNNFVDAHQLLLPATGLASSCYDVMFENCVNLSAAPQMPATIVENNCYRWMFRGCTKLTQPPTIYATKLGSYSCQAMFNNCTSLTFTPSFNTLSITSPSSCQAMFMGCTNLKYSQDFITPTIASYCFNDTFKNCSNLLIPPTLSSLTIKQYGCYAMFSGCTKLQYIPPLISINLNTGCYREMFSYCGYLISEKTYLPATDLVTNCYYSMFSASKLSYIVVKFTDWKESVNATVNWLLYNQSTSRSKEFCCYEQLSVNSRDVSHIPTDWTVKNNDDSIKLIFNDTLQVGNLQLFYLRKK